METIWFTFYERLLKHTGGLHTKQLLIYLEMNQQNSNGLRHDQPKKPPYNLLAYLGGGRIELIMLKM
jgi:hypothetical protein